MSQSETVSPALLAAYNAWKARKIANLPSAELWASRQRAKFTPERIARKQARMAEIHERNVREYKARMEAMGAALK